MNPSSSSVCLLLALFLSSFPLPSLSRDPVHPKWGPEVSMNVSMAFSLQYSYSRNEYYVFNQGNIRGYTGTYWTGMNAPYIGMHVDCTSSSVELYIPDIILGGLVCYVVPSVKTVGIINTACPLTDDAFEYFLHQKDSTARYLGSFTYDYDGHSNLYAWGIEGENAYCCDYSYSDWCCPFYYDDSFTRAAVGFANYEAVTAYVRDFDNGSPAWNPPVSTECRRINPDLRYSRTAMESSDSNGHAHRLDRGVESSLSSREEEEEDFVMGIINAMCAADKALSVFDFPLPSLSRQQQEKSV